MVLYVSGVALGMHQMPTPFEGAKEELKSGWASLRFYGGLGGTCVLVLWLDPEQGAWSLGGILILLVISPLVSLHGLGKRTRQTEKRHSS